MWLSEKKRPLKSIECKYCDGKGFEVDYVGWFMVPQQVNCSSCGGTGRAALAAHERGGEK